MLLYTRFAECPPQWPIALLAALRERRPEAQLLVVGEGLHGEDALFMQAVQAAGLQNAVVTTRWPGSEAAGAYLAAATVAIVPFQDTLLARTKCSVKLLELMSLGIPIVASAVGENVRYLDYGRAGRLISAGLDPVAWAAAVDELLDSPLLRAEMSTAASLRLRQHHLWDTAVGSVEEAYRSVCPGVRTAGPWRGGA